MRGALAAPARAKEVLRKPALAGIVLGAALGVIAYALYVSALWLAVGFVPDPPAMLFGLQMLTGFAAAMGGWIGGLVTIQSHRRTVDRLPDEADYGTQQRTTEAMSEHRLSA
jgi:hypothetical protein